jgi:hypothetical protein
MYQLNFDAQMLVDGAKTLGGEIGRLSYIPAKINE